MKTSRRIVRSVAEWITPSRLLTVKLALTASFAALGVVVALHRDAAVSLAFMFLLDGVVKTWKLKYPR